MFGKAPKRCKAIRNAETVRLSRKSNIDMRNANTSIVYNASIKDYRSKVIHTLGHTLACDILDFENSNIVECFHKAFD